MSSFPRRRRWLLWLRFFLLSLWTVGISAYGNKTCYFPSGVASPGKPCHPDAAESVCCGPGFTCLSNGVCQTGPIVPNETLLKYSLYRSGCTDDTFNDPACPRFCIGKDDNRGAGQGLQLCSAELGTYCCRRDYDCCTNSTITYTLGQAGVVTTIPRLSVNVPTHSSVVAHPVAETKVSRYARDTIIGAGTGVGVAIVLFLLGGCAWLLQRNRKRRTGRGGGRSRELRDVDPNKLGSSKDVSVSVSAVGESSEPIELDDIPSYEQVESRRAEPRTDQHNTAFEPEGHHTPERRPG